MKMEVGGGGRELEERKEDRKEQFLGTRRDGTRRDETRRDGGEAILFKAEHFTAARSTLVMENPPAAPTN